MDSNFKNAIDAARERLDDMEEIIRDAEPDGPHGLLEAAHETQEQINRAVHSALVPVLKRYEDDARAGTIPPDPRQG